MVKIALWVMVVVCVTAGVANALVGSITLANGNPVGLVNIGMCLAMGTLAIVNYKNLRRFDGSNRKAQESHTYTEAGGNMGAATNSASPAASTTPDVGAIPLESVDQAEPIRAWRGVRLDAGQYTVWLGSVNAHFGAFAADEHKATCRRQYQTFGVFMGTESQPQVHDAPGLNCKCGFYGVKDKADAYGMFVAEADFYGTVIEHEAGYRAEYQRILSVRVIRPEHCTGGFLCDGRPELVAFPPAVPIERSSLQGTHTEMRSPGPLIVCDQCASKHERVATLQQLAARLGVEVRWA